MVERWQERQPMNTFLAICCCFTLAQWHCLALVVCWPPSAQPSTCQMLSRTRHSTSPSPRFNLGSQDRPDAHKGAQIELSEIRFPEPPSPLSDITIRILPLFQRPWHPPQYMNPDGMSLGLRNSTLGLCLLGWDLYGNRSVLFRASSEV